MMTNLAFAVALATVVGPIAGCARAHQDEPHVRQEDLTAWEGQPVELLDKHLVFLTMRSVRTVTADGTEIRNYVNGAAVGACDGGGAVVQGGFVNSATYSQFSSCIARFAACNNIFYVKSGHVLRYAPIGTGGARCYTNEATNPNFSGAANI